MSAKHSWAADRLSERHGELLPLSSANFLRKHDDRIFAHYEVAETICKAVLVVFTAYLPKTHDLGELGRRCARACPNLGPMVPHDAPDRKRLATLLRAAYVDARYSFTFEVSREDLETLARYLCTFRERAERACQERLAELPRGCPEQDA